LSPVETIPSTDALSELLQRAVASSPADETELLWTGVVRRAASTGGKGRDEHERREEVLLVRVRERGRVGTHRTGSTAWGDVEQAIRAALAQARAHEPLPGLPHLPGEALAALPALELHDPELAALDCESATALLRRAVERHEQARLRWQSGEILLASSRAPFHRLRATGAALAVRSGRGAGEGLASGAARTLAGLALAEVVARARSRRAAASEGTVEPVGALPGGAIPVWFSPEAVGELIHLLASTTLTAHAHRDGSSFLRHLLGTQVFDRRLTLIDDGLEASGMPFPFDLEGAAKRRIELIAAGTPRTPALDQRHAALFGMPATAHAAGGDDARAENLFLLGGESSFDDLARAAAGGIFVADLERTSVLPPEGRRFSAIARGVRRVTAEGVSEPLPDFRFEDSLPRGFAHVLAVGNETVLTSPGDPFYGGVRAPALVIDAVSI
jgi:predicted Zn-dependent protease